MKKNLAVFAAVVLVVLGYYVVDFFSFDGEIELETVIEVESEIKVYITGEVASPGVYALTGDVRIEDLIAAAGGVTDAANLRTINLAMRLEDGDKVVIPAVSEEQEEEPRDLNSMTAEDFMEIETIGAVTAERIVSYREEKGYLVLEDLIEVEGIGQAKLEVIRQYLEN